MLYIVLVNSPPVFDNDYAVLSSNAIIIFTKKPSTGTGSGFNNSVGYTSILIFVVVHYALVTGQRQTATIG